MLKGVDVSSYQKKPDWAKVKESGYDFAILRISTKNGKIDSSFEHNLSGCRKNNILTGVYKFSYALNEAQNVLGILSGAKLGLPVWLDLEWEEQRKLGRDKITAIARAFLSTIATAGYLCGIYCNLNWYHNVLDIKTLNYDYWIARYGNNNGKAEERYRPGLGEAAWQYSSKGSVPGIDGAADVNLLYKDYAEMKLPPENDTDIKCDFPTLRKGTSSCYVKILQALLNSYGYHLLVDNIFGSNTYQAVIAFQGLEGLTKDGVVGQKTWKKLLE